MIKRLVGAFNYSENAVLAYFFVGLGILIVIDIPGRKFGLTSFYWLEEFGRYVMIFMTLLGASKAVKGGNHLSMNAVVRRLPNKVGHFVQGITNFACFVFLAYLDYYAWSHIVHMHKIGLRTSTLGIPFYIPYLPVAVFLIGMFVRFLISSVKEFFVVFKEEIEAVAKVEKVDFE